VVDFASAWPSARAPLAAVLRGRGLQGADVDDIVQEVAVRALREPRAFDSEDHLVAWCCRVGINLHIDATRRQARLSGDPLPEPVANNDTAATVERRLALEIVACEIAQLSEEERRLLFEIEPAASRKDAVRLAVRRHRLRARLAALVEGALAGVPIVRRVRLFRRSLSTSAKLSLAAAPIVAAGLVLGPLTTGGPAPGTRDFAPAVRLPLLTASPAAAEGSGGARTTQPATLAPKSSRPLSAAAHPAATTAVVDAAPAGVPVILRRERGVEDPQPLACTSGVVDACVARPPGVPRHTVPTLP